MSKHLHTLSLLFLSLLLALTGCGDPVVDPGYRGESLLTVQGQLRATPDYQPKGPLHVALVWFPSSVLANEDENAEVPDLFMMVTEDVTMSGQFPLEYRFDVFQPPPPEALAAWGQGLEGKGAMGLLVAYEDLNRNGKLDRIAINGTPTDRIVGSSIYEVGNPYMVVYTDTAQKGVPAGFSLGGSNGEVLPATTPLTLTLTAGGDLYDALVCEAGWVTFILVPVCGLGEGEQEPLPVTNLSVSGEVKVNDGHLVVELWAFYKGEQLTDGELKLGEQVIPFDAQRNHYRLTQEASTLLTPGATVRLAVSAHGETTYRDLVVPGDFSITGPAAGAAVGTGTRVMASWTAAPGATKYRVELESPSAYFSTGVPDGALSYPFDAGSGAGPAELRVEAISSTNRGTLYEPFNVDVALVKAQAFTLVP